MSEHIERSTVPSDAAAEERRAPDGRDWRYAAVAITAVTVLIVLYAALGWALYSTVKLVVGLL